MTAVYPLFIAIGRSDLGQATGAAPPNYTTSPYLMLEGLVHQNSQNQAQVVPGCGDSLGLFTHDGSVSGTSRRRPYTKKGGGLL